MKRWSRQVKYPKEWQLKFGTSYSDPSEQLPRHQLQTDVFSWRNDFLMFKENFNNYCLAKIISVNFSFFFCFHVRSTLKICWFSVLLPTHPKQALPKKCYCLSENLFFNFLFFSNSVNKPFFKIIKCCILIKETGYRDCYYMHSYLIYSICRPLKVIARRS